ncbi:MAG: SPOR domain-containing protein [Spirochaetota bacterium]
MEEHSKRPREYYQVNLDTGRIFLISFILGLVLIGVFVLGLYVGGKKEGGVLVTGRTGPEEEVTRKPAEETTKPPVEDLLETDLEAEAQYVEIEGLEGTEDKKGLQPSKTPRPQTKDKAIEKKPTSAYTPPTVVEEGEYYIQVGSFIKNDNAYEFSRTLRRHLYKVEIEEASVEEKVYYRVRVGPFKNKRVAANTMASMKRRFNLQNPFVLKKG